MQQPGDSEFDRAPANARLSDTAPAPDGGNTPTLKHQVQLGQLSFTAAVAAFERDLICDALERAHHIQTRAARMLGITRRVLKYRMDALGIPVQRIRTRMPNAA